MMRPGIPAMCVALLLFGTCGISQESSQLTEQKKDQIKREVKAVGDRIMARFQAMDAEGALRYYAQDFVGFGAKGARFNLQEYKKRNIDAFSSATAYEWTLYHLDFIVITEDTVVLFCDGKNETLMKSGDKITFDPSHYTFVFKKIEGQWKVVYHHFSGTLVTEKARKISGRDEINWDLYTGNAPWLLPRISRPPVEP
jgi:ketosteroid isomerase-like protein